MDLRGKVVLITGASRGIGRACAAAFRSRGSRVSLMARSEAALRAAGSPSDVVTPGDVTEGADRERAVTATLERFGRIDVLINNAGMGMYTPAARAPLGETRSMFELNFFAPLAMTQLVIPHMQEQRSGVIVNVSSIAGKVTLPWATLYSASKYALGSLTDGLRMELRQYGIHTLTVCPGYVKTEFHDHAFGARPPDRVVRSRRFAITPERCAEAIVRGIELGKRDVVTPGAGWLFVIAERLFPGFVDARMAAMNRSDGAAV